MKLNLPKFGKASHANGTSTTTSTTTAPGVTEKRAGLPSWMLFIRLFQLLLVIIILGLSAYEINVWRKDIGCSSPGRVNFNLAATIIALIFLAYHILSSSSIHVLPSIVFAQIPMDFLMFIFFIAAAAVAKYTYGDFLSCYVDTFTRRSLMGRSPRGGRGGGSSRGSRGGSSDEGDSDQATTTTARQGLDAFLGITFLLTLALTAFFGFKSGFKGLRKNKTTTGATPMTGGVGTQQSYPQGGEQYGTQNQAAPQQYPQTTGGTAPPYPEQQYPQTTGGTYPPQQQYPQATGGYPPQQQQGYAQPAAEMPQPHGGYAAPGTEHKMA